MRPQQIGRPGTVRSARATRLYEMGGPELAFQAGGFDAIRRLLGNLKEK